MADNNLQTLPVPEGATLSEQEMRLLGSIFRLMPKEIISEADIETLAPGELGISYITGSLYARNPHNGKIFSPNSMELVHIIASKLEPITNKLEADRVNGITFYKELADLDPLPGIKFTPDAVIRQMHYPAVFLGLVNYDNAVALGWPKPRGMCLVYKFDVDAVYIKYFDTEDHMAYEGRYSSRKHLFEGWISEAGGTNFSASSLAGGDELRLTLDDEVHDLTTVTVHLEHDLNPRFTVAVNGHDPELVVTPAGEVPGFPIPANNDIMLMYDEDSRRWMLFDATESVTSASIRVLDGRVNEIYRNFGTKVQSLSDQVDVYYREYQEEVQRLAQQFQSDLADEAFSRRAELAAAVQTCRDTLNGIVQSFTQDVEELRTKMADHYREFTEESARLHDLIVTRPGNIVAIPYTYEASGDDVGVIALPEDFDDNDKLLVNYGQTLLQINNDYTVDDQGIVRLVGFTLARGDRIQFIILKQE